MRLDTATDLTLFTTRFHVTECRHEKLTGRSARSRTEDRVKCCTHSSESLLSLSFPRIQASELEDEAQAQVARIGSEAHEARRERDEALKALHAAELTATKHENEVKSSVDALF